MLMHKRRVGHGPRYMLGSWGRLGHRQRHGHMHRGLRHRLRLWELGMTSASCAGGVGVDAKAMVTGEMVVSGV